MKLTPTKTDGSITHVVLSGRLDIEGVHEVNVEFTSLVSSQGLPAIVDLSDVPFISSLGMRMLLASAKTLKARGSKMVLLKPQAIVKESLDIAGFCAIIPVAYDYENALKQLSH
ncbi:MAG: hypothetical protein A2X49_07160 [Lentisphaerae bacterium GWF2_52_8]|nr:MAG: hypothetical protein A2X49_07160 [Lentisphaerae bacterium GWF2_52_8]